MDEPQTPESPAERAPAAPADRAAEQHNPELREEIVHILKTVYDPEIPVDIYELGLIYGIAIDEEDHVTVRMTLTSPMCPVAETLPPEVEQKVAGVPGVKHAEIDLTWEPPWDPSMMSEAARLELGF